MKKITLLLILVLIIQASPRCSEGAEVTEIIWDESVKSCSLQDGATIKVHYRRQDLRSNHAYPDRHADKILEYAKDAYTDIVYNHGFNTPGFTFANPDKNYSYDIDKTIDIFIRTDAPGAPCYDIIKGNGPGYDAIIILPADYKSYLANSISGDISEAKLYERMKGTLYHELLHVITYSYNKNIMAWYRRHEGSSYYQGGDWYVEGLARYYETLAGSYHNFFSRGSVKKKAKKLIVAQDGANFLMEHPSQPLEEARYDYALFWAYIHETYGMDKVEEISRKFRFISKDSMKDQIPLIITNVLEKDFENVLKDFAVAMYRKDFAINIKEGLMDLKSMTLDDFSKKPEKRVESWSSNFITLDLERKDIPSSISIKKRGKDCVLQMAVMANLEDSKMVQLQDITLDKYNACTMDLSKMRSKGVEKLILIITNTNPDRNASYRLLRN